MTSAPPVIRLADYRPSSHRVERVDLHFDLGETVTRVASRLELRRHEAASPEAPLVLSGSGLALRRLALDGRELGTGDYAVEGETLTIAGVPQRAVLEVETEIRPAENTALEGLYLSSGNFCTQCEAEGFRKITWYPDRPDVLARFSTTLVADRETYPVLLSNGNLVEKGELEGGRHFARWEDPYPKPSYLFALVAGRLEKLEDTFTTRSGREVTLQIWTEERNRGKCGHAMASLKKAMRWDEETFGLEYDLDIYMIVAVDDFNMGAMENKGLNLFNSKYVLASPETATDADYQAIEEVIGHEYFHNWTGNRVTCRDWFQLSLKEGLTVFRDQEFSAEMTSRAVKRIEDVRLLRNTQFPEDAGPTAHPVRPDTYVEINNFYTATVYNKGAEVIRMYQALLGREGFRRGLRRYLERHDGEAATVDDFAAAMGEANGVDFTQFKRWYSQAGTPVVTVERAWDASRGEYSLTVRQSCPPTPGQERKEPFHIPLTLGLIGKDGQDLPLRIAGEPGGSADTSRTLEIRNREETFTFTGLPEEPVLSLLRGFSAPVRLQIELSDAELAFLLARDSDEFNRWEAGQQLAARLLLRMAAGEPEEGLDASYAVFREAFRATLNDPADPALVAQALTLPTETYLAEQQGQADPEAIHQARESLRLRLARELKDDLLRRMNTHRAEGPYSPDPRSAGRRSLKNLCLAYLSTLPGEEAAEPAWAQYRTQGNMTDVLAALGALNQTQSPRRLEALEDFYRRWAHEPLVVDKWFTLQATSRRADTHERVRELMKHPAFTLKNPNRVRSLIGAFAQGNPGRFHRRDGAGYRLLADQVLTLDRLNPQVAARLLGPLTRWRRFAAPFGDGMRAELERIAATAGLSRDVFEIVGKSLSLGVKREE